MLVWAGLLNYGSCAHSLSVLASPCTVKSIHVVKFVYQSLGYYLFLILRSKPSLKWRTAMLEALKHFTYPSSLSWKVSGIQVSEMTLDLSCHLQGCQTLSF